MAEQRDKHDMSERIGARPNPVRLDSLTSESSPEEIIKRLRKLKDRAARLREMVDASRETYSR